MQHSPTQQEPLLNQRPPSIPIPIPSPRRRSPHVIHPNPEHQWSVFGQLMENEGHLVGISPTSYSSRTSSPGDYFTRRGGMLSDPTQSSLRPFTPIRLSPSLETSPGRAEHGISAETIEYDSDCSSLSVVGGPPDSNAYRPSLSHKLGAFGVTPVWRNVFKCAIAYFVASLFTFSPYLSRWIAPVTSDSSRIPSPTGHMVATIAVYFHPAKTVGAMIEADLFFLFGLGYSAFVCLTSMSMFWWLERKPGWEWAGDFVAISWIGVSMSFLAWLKVWMANPSFNTACSMVAIIIFVVVVKEGGLDILIQVSTITLCGSLVSNLVCYFIWPQRAISNLQGSMINTLESFSTLLPLITRLFLLEDDAESHILDLEKVQRAVENHQSSFTSLKKSLREAKTEWTLVRSNYESDPGERHGNLSGRRAYEDTVDCLNRLAQHLNGLRSGTRLQQDLIRARLSQNSINDNHSGAEPQENDDPPNLSAAATMFGDLLEELGSPLKALSTVSTSTINKLRSACSQSHDGYRKSTIRKPQEFLELVDNIEAALVRFESTSNHAVLRAYMRSDMQHITPPNSSSSQSSYDVITRNDNESIFLVYFFIFILQEFAGELVSLIDAIERIYYYELRLALQKPWWHQLLTTVTACFRNLFQPKSGERRPRGLNLRRSLTYMITSHRIALPWFPKVRPHAPDTIQTPSWDSLTFLGKIDRTVWSIGKRLTERDTKFAIKVGMATAILASPAFIDVTRPVFLGFFGDWALISFFVVISPTVGATNYLSLQRFLGTIFGATVAVLLYTSFPEDAIVLSIFGFVFSIPCFWWAVAKPQYQSASRFVLLTYNLTCLYCYNLRQKDPSAVNVGFHRAIAVTVGILWAVLVSRFWWPSEARRELSKSLSEFFLDLGWLYTRLVASNSFSPEYSQEEQEGENVSPDPRRIHVTRLTNSIQEFMAMELHLQIKLIGLQGLLAEAQLEPRLKGPFPVALYRQILTSLQTILDKLHSMRCVTTKEEWYTSVRQDFIVPVNRERREMVGNIILSFSTLAAAFRLKAPLPPYLPPAEESRRRLVEAIRRLDVVKNREIKGSRQLLFFAYALTMKGVTVELDNLGKVLQDAFGVIGPSAEDFEMLFLPIASIV